MQALSPEEAAFVSSGVAIIVATRDRDLRPEIGRGWGPVVDGTTLVLCVTSPSGSSTRENLEANGAIAVTCSRPTTYRTIQLKGTALEVRDALPADEERVAVHLEAFMGEVMQVGVQPEFRAHAIDRPLVAVTFAIRELYDQTPGPGAGAPL